MRDTLGGDDGAACAVLHRARASPAGPPSRTENVIERITRARIHTSRAQRPVPAGSCEDVTDRDAMRCRHERGSCASRRRRHESAFHKERKRKSSQPGKAGPATLARTASPHPAHTPRHPNPASRSAMAELYDRSQTNCSGPGSAQIGIACVKTRPVTTSMGCETVPRSGYPAGARGRWGRGAVVSVQPGGTAPGAPGGAGAAAPGGTAPAAPGCADGATCGAASVSLDDAPRPPRPL